MKERLTVEIADIGERDRRQSEAHGPFDQLFDRGCTEADGVVALDVQRHHHGNRGARCWREGMATSTIVSSAADFIPISTAWRCHSIELGAVCDGDDTSLRRFCGCARMQNEDASSTASYRI